ncbi:MAG: hypothetical protein H0T73_13280 [Ardenticatenales bacterium]|nr:hypothetical protein [Ardenticatenales bacterium]
MYFIKSNHKRMPIANEARASVATLPFRWSDTLLFLHPASVGTMPT